jgi:hypothetical protein
MDSEMESMGRRVYHTSFYMVACIKLGTACYNVAGTKGGGRHIHIPVVISIYPV